MIPESLAYIGVGSNMGRPEENCRRALEMLEATQGCRLEACSRLYRTEPVGPVPQDWFVNLAAAVRTHLTPHQLLRVCQDVEGALGRRRDVRWGPRVIDLDLLLFDEIRLQDAHLVLPHPEMIHRRFVLQPLAELAPDRRIPGTGRSVEQLLGELPAAESVEPLEPVRCPIGGRA